MGTSKQPATYDDVKKLPDHVVGEIIDGESIVSPRPHPVHAHAAGAICADLVGPFGRPKGTPGGWLLLWEPELHLHGDVVVPNVAGWRRERGRLIDPWTPAIELSPDWVCEVISPSTARYDRSCKMRIYEREKVAHVWLVDPLNLTLEEYHLDGEHMSMAAVYGGADRPSVAPFAAVELDLSGWWWLDEDSSQPAAE